MSENFESGLRDLSTRAAQAHDAGAGLPMAAMVGRARRNRQVRAVAVSAVATVAVIGVALGGAAVVRLNDSAPVPPAVTSTPSPTTTTEPAGTVLTCGAVIADLPVFEVAPVTVEATLDTPALTVTDPVVGTVVMAAVDPPGPMIANEIVFGLRYLVVQDGVVVGIGRDNGDAPVVPLSGRDGIAHEATISLSGCDEDNRTTVQLATGDYELYAGFSAQIAGGPGGEGVVLGGPWPFTITDEASPSGQTPEAMPLLPPENHYVESSSVSAIPLSEDSLEDGDYFGYLSGIDAAAGTVQVDIAIFYTGQAAIDYLTANDPEAENPPPNGYIIVNDVKRTRTLNLSPDVRIWDLCYGNDLGFAERPLPEWAAAPATGEHSCDAGAALSRGWGDETYWFDVRDGVVLQVVGQFLP